ncbi:MAG: peptidylprolyl isomerase [Synechococcaceae cyanobacterium]|nr:peptidylprolyl isomerase [Synechococcaceae cyanobacterium]
MKAPLWRQLVWAPLLLLALTLPLGLVACAAERGAQPLGCASGTIPCLSGTAVVALETSRGRVLLRLDGKNAPLTAGNFVDLVRRGVYDGTIFHRVVREPVPFVVQGGDPSSANPRVAPSQYGSGNFIDPSSGEARLIPLEIKRQQDGEPQYGKELTTPVITKELALSHQRGSLAMARSQDPNSASAQFYIALEALPELDGRYAVFGQVTQGMEVVDAIRQGDKLVKARLIEGGKLVKGEP